MMQKGIDKIVNVYKPAGITSYDVVRRVKQVLPGVKVGHGGTLDPFAEGVLLILLGRATKRMSQLLQLPKSYEAVLQLGAATASGDNTTSVVQTAPVPTIDQDALQQVAAQFLGTQTQTPPSYSAKKVAGCPAYRLARRGETPTLNPVTVTIYHLALTMLETDKIAMQVTCSAGTYIRRLGEDIASSLGTCGHLVSLKRTHIGTYDWQSALDWEELGQVLPDLVMEATA